MRLWERIHKTLVKDLQGFMGLWERICEGFGRFWERIHKTLGKDLQDFGKGFIFLTKNFFLTILFFQRKFFSPTKNVFFKENFFLTNLFPSKIFFSKKMVIHRQHYSMNNHFNCCDIFLVQDETSMKHAKT